MTANRSKGEILIKVWKTTGEIVIIGFLLFSMIIGGSAGLGYQENGHYFVRNHGDVVEVSEAVWTISGIWEILFWVSIPLTLIGDFVISKLQEKRERSKIDLNKEKQDV